MKGQSKYHAVETPFLYLSKDAEIMITNQLSMTSSKFSKYIYSPIIHSNPFRFVDNFNSDIFAVSWGFLNIANNPTILQNAYFSTLISGVYPKE